MVCHREWSRLVSRVLWVPVVTPTSISANFAPVLFSQVFGLAVSQSHHSEQVIHDGHVLITFWMIGRSDREGSQRRLLSKHLNSCRSCFGIFLVTPLILAEG